MGYFNDAGNLLFSSAIFCCFSLFFAVPPLLSPAVFRCYFVTAVFKNPRILWPREVLPLYCFAIISGVARGADERSVIRQPPIRRNALNAFPGYALSRMEQGERIVARVKMNIMHACNAQLSLAYKPYRVQCGRQGLKNFGGPVWRVC